MKIAFVSTHMTFFTGVGIFISDYANDFIEGGHKITIVAQRINKNLFNLSNKIQLKEVGGSLPSKLSYWFNFYRIKKRYVKILKTINCDIIISHLFPTNYFCSIAKKYRDFIHIYYCHEPFRFFHDKTFYTYLPPILKVINWFFRILFKKCDIKGANEADLIICNSNFTKRRVKSVYEKNSILHYPILKMDKKNNLKNKNTFQRLSIDINSHLCLCLGLSHHMKGAKELINIFNKIVNKYPETVLLIVGKISKINLMIIKKSIKQLKIPKDKVIFYGQISKNELKSIYKSSYLTFYTAIKEPFGQIPIESMNYGIPVIAFEGGGPSETIIDGKTGYLIKNYDIEDFAKKAIYLIENKLLRNEMSIQAQEHISNNFQHNMAVKNLKQIIKKKEGKK